MVEETQMVAATALCACGIAFFCRAIRAAAQGGIEIGSDVFFALLGWCCSRTLSEQDFTLRRQLNWLLKQRKVLQFCHWPQEIILSEKLIK